MENIDILYLDLLGTAVFAYVGSTVTRQRGFDVVTVCALGIVTAIGGGTVRQWLLQADTLFWLEDFRYLLVCAIAITAGYLTAFKLDVKSPSFRFIDNLAIAVFISIGYTIAADITNSIPISVALGICTGIGGGLVRDALAAQVPRALTDPIMPCLLIASLLGICIASLVGIEIWIGSCIGVASIEAGRILTNLAKLNRVRQFAIRQTIRRRFSIGTQ